MFQNFAVPLHQKSEIKVLIKKQKQGKFKKVSLGSEEVVTLLGNRKKVTRQPIRYATRRRPDIHESFESTYYCLRMSGLPITPDSPMVGR